MFRTPSALIASAILTLASGATAAKVVRLYNPWLSYGSELVGKIRLVNYYPMNGWTPSGTANVFKQSNGAWLELSVPDGTIPAGTVNFTVNLSHNAAPYTQDFGTKGIGGGDMDLGTPLSTFDTVWIIPSPLPNGPAKIVTTAPREMTVMLWNPFEHDASAQRPSMKVESSAWSAMDSVASAPGWYSSYTLGFTNLNLLFRNADSTKSFGASGVGLPIGAVFDSLVGRNDTIWVWASPEPSGVPRASAAYPKMRTIMLFNPWDGLLPFQRPSISFGAGTMSMLPDAAYCGWTKFHFMDRSPLVTFANSRTGQTVGSTGFGGTGPIDLSSAFLTSDTAWVTTAAGTGLPTVRGVYTGEKGMCEISLLAATVRDFDSTHHDFEEGSTNSCGLVKGMIASTLGPDRKPLPGANHCRLTDSRRVVDSGLTTQWFRDVPAVNATTCRDIPLAINDNTGNYVYDDSAYFPIDEFSTLDDGSPNPHFQTFTSYVDSKKHNYHYCLESHGEFDYKKGQKFSFRGDDDVWFFIDNRLVVDLGGVHNPEVGAVDLDTMKLVEGNTYTFDFFYCERQTVGANMRIETSMNLRTPSGFKVADTLRGPGIRSFDLYVSQKLGQGCSSNENVQKTAGRFTLGGGQFASAITLPSGVSYGGISIDASMGKLILDSASIAGLAPGTYALRILPAGADTTGARTIYFVVPLRAQPYFLAKPAYTGLVGTSLSVSVVSRTNAGAVDPNAVRFVLHPIPGLRYFRDSLQTSEVLAGDTLMTGAGGVPRVLWVRGEAVGEYTLRVGFSATDTVDTYPGISFQDRLLRYVDALGTALAPVPAIDRDVRTAQQVFIEAVMNGSTCLACADTVLLTGTAGLEFRSSAAGAPLAYVVLKNGRASFWVYGASPVSAGMFRGTLSDGSASAPWSPVTFRAPSLRFEDSAGASLSALSLELGSSAKVWIQAHAAIDTCARCDVSVRVLPDPLLVASATAMGLSIDSVVLAGGRAALWLRARAPLPGGFVVARGDSLWASDTLVVSAVAQKLRFVDSLGNDLPAVSGTVRTPVKVWLEVRGVAGLCTSCNQNVALAISDPEVTLSASAGGAAIASVALVGGRASIWIVSGASAAAAPLFAASDSLWSSDTLPLTFAAKAPDSAFWSDVDGDGSVDRLVVHLALPWRSNSTMQASWPGAAPLFDASIGVFALSADSLIATWSFVPGLAPLTTQGPASQGALNWDGRGVLAFPIRERVAPVPLRAYLRYGSGTDIDTVRIPWSEAIVGGYANSDELVLLEHAGVWAGAHPAAQVRDTVTGELLLLYRADDVSEPVPGDSLRFSPSGALKDALGNVPGANARRVVIQGTDRAPLSASMLDANGDGRADRVVLRFRAAPVVSRAFSFAWSDPAGAASRLASIDSARTDSAGRILIFDLPPFAYGYTGCPVSGCADLGGMISVWGGDTARLVFPLRDEVAPVPTRARLRYNANPAGPDTLIVDLVEPIVGSDIVGSAWFSVGRPSVDPEGETISWIGSPDVGVLSADRRTATFLVDTSFSGGKGDSIRAASAASFGSVADSLGNRPGTPSGWVPLEIGPHPMFLVWKPMPSVRKYEGWDPPAGEPALQILVRDPVTGRWTRLDGSDPGQDTAHYGGIYLKFNRAMKGSAYLYDNLGVFVADVGLDEIARAIESEGVKPDARGNYEVWLAWNGTSMGVVAKGKAAVAPSGVYVFRVVAHYEEDGHQVLLNQLFKSGWKR